MSEMDMVIIVWKWFLIVLFTLLTVKLTWNVAETCLGNQMSNLVKTIQHGQTQFQYVIFKQAWNMTVLNQNSIIKLKTQIILCCVFKAKQKTRSTILHNIKATFKQEVVWG